MPISSRWCRLPWDVQHNLECCHAWHPHGQDSAAVERRVPIQDAQLHEGHSRLAKIPLLRDAVHMRREVRLPSRCNREVQGDGDKL